MLANRTIPAVVTAGGRIAGALADHTGIEWKALLPLHQTPMLHHILTALRETTAVGDVTVVGPSEAIAETAYRAGASTVLPEGRDGDENLFLALEQLHGESRILFVASDLPFVDSTALTHFLKVVTPLEADIVYPILSRSEFEATFPGVTKTYARLVEGEFTGGSVFLLNPQAVLQNRTLISQVFQARKNELAMATLLGLPFALRYKMGRLTITDAERRASELTGCKCHALRTADPRLAYDIDDLPDYEYAINYLMLNDLERD
jgi:GTP:adenosylcobinamide-phosphate guanylyltransferase